MNAKEAKRISKFLSLVLRHQPETIGITLDEAGWVDVNELLSAMASKGRKVTRGQLEHVVESNDKQRFSISDDGLQIRARQGHSVEVELGYPPSEPPETLIHGTPSTSVEKIKKSGLKKMKRHHIHLHSDQKTATEVGKRRGKAVLLTVRSKEMHDAGYEFFVTENKVWLTDNIPPEFIEFPDEQ